MPSRLASAQRFLAAPESRFRVAFDNLRVPDFSAVAGGVLAGDAASAWVADATLDLAASSKSFTSVVPESYWSMTVPSIVSTRCSRLRAFFTFIYCSWAFVITRLSQSVFRRKPRLPHIASPAALSVASQFKTSLAQNVWSNDYQTANGL